MEARNESSSFSELLLRVEREGLEMQVEVRKYSV